MNDFKVRIDDLNERMKRLSESLNIPIKEEDLKKLEKLSLDPKLWDDQENARSVMHQLAAVKDEIKEIKDASSKLLSFAWVFSFRKKKKFQFVDISQNVNGSVMASQSKNKSDLTFSIECLNNLKKYKFLKVTFE